MMLHSEIQGEHRGPEQVAMTIQDLLDILKSVPRQARDSYVMLSTEDGPVDLCAVQFAQSDQAEKWEFKVYLKGQGS